MYIQYIDGFNVKIKVDFEGKNPRPQKIKPSRIHIFSIIEYTLGGYHLQLVLNLVSFFLSYERYKV